MRINKPVSRNSAHLFVIIQPRPESTFRITGPQRSLPVIAICIKEPCMFENVWIVQQQHNMFDTTTSIVVIE
jgi:hypothetical protein